MNNSIKIVINNKEETILNEKVCDKSEISNKKEDFSEIKDELKNIAFFNDNFELKNYIDSGSESKVFQIINKKQKKDYILKYIINKKKTKKNDELYISKKLKNKNIIGLYGYIPIKENNSESFIMEYAKYGNLRNFQIKVLKRPYLSESMLLFFFYQILNGLVYCHRCKIAHMDIKPQNIVIDDFLNAKLIDFSISLNYSDKKPNDTIKLPFKGTNFYMSSEIINSNTISYKNLNKVDAYALGVTLYNLAFGIFPYNLEYGDEQNFKLINEKINGDLKIDNKDNLSPFFIDFVTKLLEKDINKRMSIYEAIQHPWIKAAKILFDEKDNTYNVYSFFINLMTDNIKNFNDYIKKDN